MVIMAVLADGGGQLRSAVEIADQAQVAAPTVRKLLKHLNQAGLVESARGARGGYRLARPALGISVADVIAALEGPIGLTECAAHQGRCGIEADCRLRPHWRVINAAIHEALAGISLADMARPAARLSSSIQRRIPGFIPTHH